MDGYVLILIIGAATSLLGLCAVSGTLSLSLGSHKEVEHSKEIWRAANVQAGAPLIALGAVWAISALIARTQRPDLDGLLYTVMLVALVLPIIGIRRALKLLGESRRTQRWSP